MEWKLFGEYFVSEYGDIKNVHGKTLKPDLTYKGYRKITLSRKKWYLHRLVATLWVDNPDNKPQVNHKDMDKLNNHYSNLEWMTNSENNLHAHRNGRNPSRSKIDNKQHKLILLDILNKVKNEEIAERNNVSVSTIWAIMKGRNQKRFGI